MATKRAPRNKPTTDAIPEGAIHVGTPKKHLHSWWTVGITGILIVLIAVAISSLWYQSKVSTSHFIAHDIATLSKMFKEINDTCGIVGFAHDVNYVDFLTVGSFDGSEVGAMHLRNAKNWKGPYVKDNPNVQTKLYEIVKTEHGYFLVPGSGVKLSNGKMMGKDVIITANTDLIKLTEHDGPLSSDDGRPLAAFIPLFHEGGATQPS